MNSCLSNLDVYFDDETMRAMSEAFDKTCDALGNFGEGVTVREIIAKRIIDVAKNGVRDTSRLYRQALGALGIDENVGQSVGSVGFPPAYASITRKA